MVLLATIEKGGTWWAEPASERASLLNWCTMGRPTSLLACTSSKTHLTAQNTQSGTVLCLTSHTSGCCNWGPHMPCLLCPNCCYWCPSKVKTAQATLLCRFTGCLCKTMPCSDSTCHKATHAGPACGSYNFAATPHHLVMHHGTSVANAL